MAEKIVVQSAKYNEGKRCVWFSKNNVLKQRYLLGTKVDEPSFKQ